MIENSVATVENAITVGNHTLPIKEYNNVRVITFKDIDMVHERPDGTASRNFRKNREYFIEGEDFLFDRPTRRNSSPWFYETTRRNFSKYSSYYRIRLSYARKIIHR